MKKLIRFYYSQCTLLALFGNVVAAAFVLKLSQNFKGFQLNFLTHCGHSTIKPS